MASTSFAPIITWLNILNLIRRAKYHTLVEEL